MSTFKPDVNFTHNVARLIHGNIYSRQVCREVSSRHTYRSAGVSHIRYMQIDTGNTNEYSHIKAYKHTSHSRVRPHSTWSTCAACTSLCCEPNTKVSLSTTTNHCIRSNRSALSQRNGCQYYKSPLVCSRRRLHTQRICSQYKHNSDATSAHTTRTVSTSARGRNRGRRRGRVITAPDAVATATHTQERTRRVLHAPVMYEEIMRKVCQDQYTTYVDATFGAGGHSRGMLSSMAPGSKLYAIDRDWTHTAHVVDDLKLGYGPRFETIHGRFGNMRELLHDRGVGDGRVSAVLFDVGVSSMQLDVPARGFSHTRNGPLDMRMDTKDEVTAADLVNNLSEEELKTVIRKLGEDPKAAQIAHAIVLARMQEPIRETVQLANIVFKAKGNRFQPGPHPATQTFQALRILLNKEIEELHNGLVDAVHMLEWGGTLAVLTFHSLEARIAKSFLKQLSQHTTLEDGTVLPPLLHKVNTEFPSEIEMARNTRSTSAILRSSMRNKHPIHPEHFTFLANTPRGD